MKTIIVKWKIKESETIRILKLLPELVEKSRKEEGNLFYSIYQSENDPNELILYEQYTDAAAAETHKQSEHYQRIVVNQIVPHLAVRDVTPVKELQ
ncbi:putative quinol monooxygenase [Methylomonas sp. MO1]|uniref:putative quinol monooxygenase n=1 Tax=Methylomonas sp. MO1 TaxID=3073619 RepID=UPI0028A3F632|nr:putative quinol monooxygenase [Methylomonas sp. MO1]MDT4289116.1 putative quinol monooxygenase [Methylomonas sp. MO1]